MADPAGPPPITKASKAAESALLASDASPRNVKHVRELSEGAEAAEKTVSHGDTKTQRRNGAEGVACDPPAARTAISTNRARAQTLSCTQFVFGLHRDLLCGLSGDMR